MKSYKIIVSEQAQIHLQESFYWYENERQGLGHEFISEPDIAFNKLSADLVDYPFYTLNIRKMPMNRFPYYIYYSRQNEKEQVLVFAVLHFKRSPQQMHKILGGSL